MHLISRTPPRPSATRSGWLSTTVGVDVRLTPSPPALATALGQAALTAGLPQFDALAGSRVLTRLDLRAWFVGSGVTGTAHAADDRLHLSSDDPTVLGHFIGTGLVCDLAATGLDLGSPASAPTETTGALRRLAVTITYHYTHLVPAPAAPVVAGL